MTIANEEQARAWNEVGGPRWVRNQRALDAQLEPLGADAIDALAPSRGERVLDVGCGAGTTTRAIAERVAPGEVVGVDISRPLIERARELAPPNVRFELADAQTFAFPEASFDAVFSRFGVMFFDDPVAAFANLRRALRRDGRLSFVCWRAMRENPSFTLPLEAGLPFLPEPPKAPPPGAPGPFSLADPDRIREVLAGWRDVAITPRDHETVFAGSPDLEAAVDLALEVGPLSRALGALDPARVRDAVRAALAPHHGPRGVVLPSATWIVTARA